MVEEASPARPLRPPAWLLAWGLTALAARAQEPVPIPEEELSLPPVEGQVFPPLRFPVLGDPDRWLGLQDFRGRKVLLFQFASW